MDRTFVADGSATDMDDERLFADIIGTFTAVDRPCTDVCSKLVEVLFTQRNCLHGSNINEVNGSSTDMFRPSSDEVVSFTVLNRTSIKVDGTSEDLDRTSDDTDRAFNLENMTF